MLLPIQVFCLCPEGMLLGQDWKTCQDVDECAEKTLQCEQQCVNTEGGAHCQCYHGFQGLNGTNCQDVDECSADDNAGCSHDCLNTAGSFLCQCPSGKFSYQTVELFIELRKVFNELPILL